MSNALPYAENADLNEPHLPTPEEAAEAIYQFLLTKWNDTLPYPPNWMKTAMVEFFRG